MSGTFQALSKKQIVTADSSIVAEFIATHTVAKEIMWARGMLFSLGFPQCEPTILFEDNMSTIAMMTTKRMVTARNISRTITTPYANKLPAMLLLFDTSLPLT